MATTGLETEIVRETNAGRRGIGRSTERDPRLATVQGIGAGRGDTSDLASASARITKNGRAQEIATGDAIARVLQTGTGTATANTTATVPEIVAKTAH